MIDLSRNSPPIPAFSASSIRSAADAIGHHSSPGTLVAGLPFGGGVEDRQAAQAWLSTRFDHKPAVEQLIVTSGIHSALLMLLVHLVGHGGTLMVESLMATGVRSLTELLGIKLEPVEIDEIGIIPEAFEMACRRSEATVMFCVPTLHNPTAAVLTQERRTKIVQIAEHYGKTIIEDDVCGFLPTDGPRPIANIESDRIWYVTGFGKCVAPGLRIGYIRAPNAVAAERLLEASKFRYSTWTAASFQAYLARTWISDGTALRHLDAIREEVTARQRLAMDILSDFDVISHMQSLHFWLRLPDTAVMQDILNGIEQKGFSLRNTDAVAVGRQAPKAVRICLGGPADRQVIMDAMTAVKQVAANFLDAKFSK